MHDIEKLCIVKTLLTACTSYDTVPVAVEIPFPRSRFSDQLVKSTFLGEDIDDIDDSDLDD